MLFLSSGLRLTSSFLLASPEDFPVDFFDECLVGLNLLMTTPLLIDFRALLGATKVHDQMDFGQLQSTSEILNFKMSVPVWFLDVDGIGNIPLLIDFLALLGAGVMGIEKIKSVT